MREAVSSARGGLALMLEPYIEMGLGDEEIVNMVVMEKGVEVDIQSVKSTKKKLEAFKTKTTTLAPDAPNRRPVEAAKARVESAERKRKRAEAEKLSYALAIRGLLTEDIEKFLNAQPNDTNSRKFARSLYEEGFITDDLKFRKGIELITEKGEALWKKSFDLTLMVEAYFGARIQEIKGHPEYMERYINLGESINAKWFYNADNNYLRKYTRQQINVLHRKLMQLTSIFE
jgi:hypothetical protein